ncbi:MAG: type IV toxin-antitoxin system AbiEi family antitoxin [bacterium]
MLLLDPMIRKTVSNFVENLQKKARYSFTKSEIAMTLGLKPSTLSKGLQRLKKAGRIAMIRRGFYVVIPLEYSTTGMIPADWFIDDLMKFLKQPYYVGVLTAATLYGASHQQPQEYQVVVNCHTRMIHTNNLRIRFFQKKTLSRTPLQKTKGYTGSLPISSPAATAMDLVRFAPAIGGLDTVLTVLVELVEKIIPEDLLSVSKQEADRCYIQRLGWLLEQTNKPELADKLLQWFKKQKSVKTPLDVSTPITGFHKDSRWQVIVNTKPQSDI